MRSLEISTAGQGADLMLASYEDLKPADLADVLHDLADPRMIEVAAALHNERLADVLEELPEDDQVAILAGLNLDRAADVLDVMQPDDAADLLAEMPSEKMAELLELMEPEEARDVRRLLAYDDDSAGGLMTTEPVVLGPETPIAAALAHVRRQDLTPALASMVFVARPPLETPTGRFLGVVHIQRLLREAPHDPIGGLLDTEIEAVPADAPLSTVTRLLATYNLLALPVVDENRRLLGAVSVDDVLDHLLPEDWREADAEETDRDDGPSSGRRAVADRLDQPRRSSARGWRPRAATRTSSAAAPRPSPASWARGRFLLYMTAFVVVWVALNVVGARGVCAGTPTRSSCSTCSSRCRRPTRRR